MRARAAAGWSLAAVAAAGLAAWWALRISGEGGPAAAPVRPAPAVHVVPQPPPSPPVHPAPPVARTPAVVPHASLEDAFKASRAAPAPAPVPGVVQAKSLEEAFAAMKAHDAAQARPAAEAAAVNPFAAGR